ncbi:AraC family transcriptional regulator [Paenibacillus sp. JSM ZJ436]|uniref:AraC family transcriptional regulator n=1 Tax=Paenibacillus sp. JSM ZJ436 TaxID=3376190 RepID=UPI0037A285C8
MKEAPERLLGSSFLDLSSSFRLFRHEIRDPIETHWHDFFEMAFVISGSGWHVVNGERFRLERGMTFLLTTADFHEIIPDEHSTIELYDFIFEGGFVRPGLLEEVLRHRGWLQYTFAGEEAREVEQAFEQIRKETEPMSWGSPMLIQGCFERILIVMARALPGEGLNAAGSPRNDLKNKLHPSIVKAVDMIQYHFREPIPLSTAAAYAGLAPNYFSECFRKQVGIPFQAYVNDKRLQFSSRLLLSSDLPVTEIGFAAGFGTMTHFERLFKRRYGCSPRQFRKNRGGEPV